MDCHFSVWGILAFLSLALIVSLILNISQYMKKKREVLLDRYFYPEKSIIYNIIFKQDKMYKDYEDCSPSYDYFYTGDDSVYGNLNQDILDPALVGNVRGSDGSKHSPRRLNTGQAELSAALLSSKECCYEQMKSQPQRPVNEQTLPGDTNILYRDINFHKDPRDAIIHVEPANQMCYASLDHSIKGKRRKPRRKKESSEEDQEEGPSKPTIMPSIYLNSEQLAAENPAKAEAVHDDPIRLMGLIHATKENV